jgi:DNA-binding IclR family transcriptional regulator
MIGAATIIQKALGMKRYVVGDKLVTLSAKAMGLAFRTARRHAVLSAVADRIGEQCEIGVVRERERRLVPTAAAGRIVRQHLVGGYTSSTLSTPGADLSASARRGVT